MPVRVRRKNKKVRARPKPRRANTTSKRQTQQQQLVSARRKLAAMEINTSPFAAVGSKVGAGIGGFFGNPQIGRGVGSWIGSGIGKIFGSGAYRMTSNTSWSTSDQCPVMHSSSESVILRHREYITDVNSSVAFVNREFPINPGLILTFPFLATIAANFQEYNFRGLVFEFKSTSADALNSTNTALGTVAMAVQYRANATSFNTKQQVLNEMWSADSKPSNSFFMPVECAPAECPMDIQYVRTGALATTDDIKFYDLGKLSLSTVGSQAAAVVGELWATYEIALRKPVLGGSIGVDAASSTYVKLNSSVAVPFGNVVLNSVNNFIGVTVSSTVITIPAGFSGKFQIMLFWYGGVGTWAIPNLAASTNITTILTNGNSTQDAGGVVGVSLGMSRTFIFSINDPALPCTLTCDGTGLYGTGVCTFELTLIQMDFDTVAT